MVLWPDTWLIPAYALAAGLGAAIVFCIAFTRLCIQGGPIDNPRGRALSETPTPTSGGLAIMAATLIGVGIVLSLLPDAVPGLWRDGLYLIGFALALGVCGALDDLFDWPAKARLLFHIALCLAFAAAYPVTALSFGFGAELQLPWALGWVGSAFWLLLGINAINFIDGSNGVAVGVQTIALLVFAILILLLAPTSAVGGGVGIFLLLSLCAAGAHIGFLPLNLMGKVFQGDAGALFGGALITGLTLVLKHVEIGSTWLGGFILAPVLVDVVLTLITRARRGENILRPHREHLYQLWLTHKNPSHFQLALKVWGLCAVSSCIGLAARMVDHSYGIDIRFPCLAVVICVYSLGWFRLRHALTRTA